MRAERVLYSLGAAPVQPWYSPSTAQVQAQVQAEHKRKYRQVQQVQPPLCKKIKKITVKLLQKNRRDQLISLNWPKQIK